MQLGICLTPIYPKAIKDCSLMLQLIEKIRGKGVFQCVEIYFEGTKEEEQEIKKSLLGSGLTAVYLGGLPIKRDGIDISAEREEKRKGSVLACKRHIDHALNMGCKKIVVASGPIWKENKNSERVIEQTRRSLEELDFYCSGSDLQISLEPFPVKTPPYMAVGGKEIVKDIFKNSNFQNIGITFDTSHFIQLEEDLEESFDSLRPWIHHLHLANCVMKDTSSALYGDQHPLFSHIGGELTLENIRKFYKKLEKEGSLKDIDICSLEIISRGKEEWYYQKVCEEAAEVWK